VRAGRKEALPGAVPGGTVPFSETGFSLRGRFLQYWRTHGLEFDDYNISFEESLALFGYPITDEFD
jgi:hypothetical protein